MFYKNICLITNEIKSIASQRPDGLFLVVHANGNTEQSDSIELVETRDSVSVNPIEKKEFTELSNKFLFG